jgi:transposase
MKLYGAIDLHSTNSYLAIIDEDNKRVFKKKSRNNSELILQLLEPYKENLEGIVVESTFNWYWLVDSLMEKGYCLHLANPAAIQKYKGMKYSDDNSDAFWLAHLLRLGILPEGYIYPKEERPVRDLLRKRGHLVHLRTSLINSLKGTISRNCGCSLSTNKIKEAKDNQVISLLSGQEDLKLSGMISKDSIVFLGIKIREIETAILGKMKLREPFIGLQTIPGVGKILAMTIMLETGSIKRFPKVGNYASYCRKVPTSWTSNNKKKGKGNKKNGNKYLSWAFSEAAEMARRFDQHAKAFYNRKQSKKNLMVAYNALAHKLTKAAYFIMRDQVVFDHNKLFA